MRQSVNILMTLEQVAERLQVHVETVRRAVRQKHLRASKVGGAWRVSDVDLETYLASNANTRPNRQPATETVP